MNANKTFPVQIIIIRGIPVKMVSLYQCHKMMGIQKKLSPWIADQIRLTPLIEIVINDGKLGAPQVTQLPPESGPESTELTDSTVGQLPPGSYIRQMVDYKVPHLGGVRTVTIDDVFVTIDAAILICISSKTEKGRQACRAYIYGTQARVEFLETENHQLKRNFAKVIKVAKENEAVQPWLPLFEEMGKKAAVVPKKPAKPRLKVTNLPVDPEIAAEFRACAKDSQIPIKDATTEAVSEWLAKTKAANPDSRQSPNQE